MCCTSIDCQDALRHITRVIFEISDMVTYGVPRDGVSSSHCCTHPWIELILSALLCVPESWEIL